MREFTSVNPIEILEKSYIQPLTPGNMGVIIARAGVGKSAFLIHTAFSKIYHHEKVVHVSLKEGPDRVTEYYDVLLKDLIKATGALDDEFLKRYKSDKMILAYLHNSFGIQRLRANLNNLINIEFLPDTILVDSLNFEDTDISLLADFKKIAEEFNVKIWFSALSHRHITDTNEKGIPYPCDKMDELFDLIISMSTSQGGIYFNVLKDHDKYDINEPGFKVDPDIILAID